MTQQEDNTGIVLANTENLESTFSLLKKLTEEVQGLTSILPNVLGSLGILLSGWIIARIFARLIRRVLSRLGTDKLAERLNEIEIVHKSNIKIVPSTLFSKLVYYLLMLIVLMAATDMLKMEAVSNLVNDIINYIPNLLMAMLVLAAGILVADAIKNAVFAAARSLAIPAAGVISSVIFYFIFINVVMMALSQAKLQTGFIESNISIVLAGVVGAFAIGYGFASRNIVASLLSAYYNKEKIKTGDLIRIEGIEGQIIAVDSTSFTVRTDQGRLVVIPLHKLNTEIYEILSYRKDD